MAYPWPALIAKGAAIPIRVRTIPLPFFLGSGWGEAATNRDRSIPIARAASAGTIWIVVVDFRRLRGAKR